MRDCHYAWRVRLSWGQAERWWTASAPTDDERLEQRIERLRAQFEWRDIGADEYRWLMLEARTELASLPEPERVVTFDRFAAIVTSLEQAMRVASHAQLRDVSRLLIERVTIAAGSGRGDRTQACS